VPAAQARALRPAWLPEAARPLCRHAPAAAKGNEESGMIVGIIPAAGRSERMGRQKLLLPLAGRPLIEHVLASAAASALDAVVLVVPADATELIQIAQRWPLELLRLAQPSEEMRVSVCAALEFAAGKWARRGVELEAFLLLPADQPGLKASTINAVIDRFRHARDGSLIVTACHAGRRGHPTLFAWKLAKSVGTIPLGRGLDYLLELHAERVAECELADPAVLADVDTPGDYEQLRRMWENRADQRHE